MQTLIFFWNKYFQCLKRLKIKENQVILISVDFSHVSVIVSFSTLQHINIDIILFDTKMISCVKSEVIIMQNNFCKHLTLVVQKTSKKGKHLFPGDKLANGLFRGLGTG